MSTYSGPREGECSEHPVPLGWLDQMMEDGNLPRDLKVWRVDGGKAWVSLGQEIKAEIKAELNQGREEEGCPGEHERLSWPRAVCALGTASRWRETVTKPLLLDKTSDGGATVHSMYSREAQSCGQAGENIDS